MKRYRINFIAAINNSATPFTVKLSGECQEQAELEFQRMMEILELDFVLTEIQEENNDPISVIPNGKCIC